MTESVEDIDALLRVTPVFRRLAPDDRRRIAQAATIRRYEKGMIIFEQDTPSDAFYTIASGRVKIYKMLASGKDLILEVFGVGDPLGAVAAYDGRPFPASAAALEDVACVVIPRATFFRLLEEHPSLVRGLMLGLTIRLVELTNRLAELSGSRIEPRFARLFLKLAGQMGRDRTRRRLYSARALPPGTGGHDGHDDRDVHPHHEPLGQTGDGSDRQGRLRHPRPQSA
jgi:CRP/FNR family transcriptional regulator, dissimilatory nitrate respiration regulator